MNENELRALFPNASNNFIALNANGAGGAVSAETPAPSASPALARQTFTLPLPPSANRYWRSYCGKRGVRVVRSAAAVAYKKRVAAYFRGVSAELWDQPVCVEAFFYFPNKRGDLDNRFKQLADCLETHAITNDSLIVEIHMYRRIDARNPRVVVTISQLDC